MERIITLTTDFGTRDPYVAEMKAVILSINQKAKIIDITHEIEKFNIKMGAFILASVYRFFPKGTIHVIVVDPGVGTERRALIVKTKHNYFIGPDNGVLSLVLKSQHICSIHEITNQKMILRKVSYTFHGRDVFAPAAAYLSKGISIERFGPRVSNFLIPTFAKVIKSKNSLIGEVLYIDSFGNIITNFGEKEIEPIKNGKVVKVGIKNKVTELKFCKTYGDVKRGEALTLIGSHGFIEISVNQGNAAKRFNVKVGDKVKFIGKE